MEVSIVNLKPGDIVQLDPTGEKHGIFGGCLLVVTKVELWGVQGYVSAIAVGGPKSGPAFYRAENGTFEPTGGEVVWGE